METGQHVTWKYVNMGLEWKKEDFVDLERDQRRFIWKQREKERGWRSIISQERRAKKKKETKVIFYLKWFLVFLDFF